jgi:O-antigen/teichoic acid export membrane protein
MDIYSRNIISNFWTKIIRVGMELVISVIIARSFGPEGKGYIAFFIIFFNFLASYGHFGINNAATYFQKRSKHRPKDVFSTNLNFLFLTWLLISTIFISIYFKNNLLSEYGISFIIVGLFLVLANFLKNLVCGFYIGEERIVEINNFLLLDNLIILIGVVLFWQLNLLTPLLYVVLRLIGVLINLIFLWLNLGVGYSCKIDFSMLISEFKYGLFVYFSALFGFLAYRIDRFIIKGFLSNSALGIYVTAVTLAELVLLVPGSITQAISGRLYNIDKDKIQKSKNLTIRTIKYSFYCSLLIALVGFLMRKLIPILYGQSFTEAVTIFSVLLIGSVFATIGKVSYPFFLTQGRPQIHFFATTIMFIVNLLGNLFLIPRVGVMGAALASVISYFSYALFYILFFNKRENVNFASFFIFDEKDVKKIKSSINYNA